MPIDPQATAVLDYLGITTLPGMEMLTPQGARDRFMMFTEMGRQMGVEPIHQVRDVKVPGPAGEIVVRIFTPDVATPAPALIYFHGGGWVFGNVDTHEGICRSLANQVPCVVASVNYRLAPEAKFPAAVEDSYAATEWISAHAGELGIDAGRIAVGGDSAGGNLATVISRMARDRKGPKLVYQVLVYPVTDLRMTAPSHTEHADAPVLTKASMTWFKNHYLRSEADKMDPQASPMLASDLSGLPPAFVLTAEYDPLRDEGEAYGQKLKEAGVPTDVIRYEGMPHGFFSFGAGVDTAKRAVMDATIRLRQAFGLEGAALSA